MKRKIAAIFAADIAGYSRLVAEDEEETLRRLASYRQVTDDFIVECGRRRRGQASGTGAQGGQRTECGQRSLKHDSDCCVIAIGPFSVGPN
jgi:hypothetical protein